MAKENNPHKGHRERVREEFLASGFSNATPPHKILEMLLFYSIPRKDTNEIAHALLDKFGSFDAVFKASVYELTQVKGVSEYTAALIKLILPICRKYMESHHETQDIPRTMDYVCDYLMNKYIGFTDEVFALTTFNNKGGIIAFDILSKGDISSVGVSSRNVVQKVIERKASAAVISHNHPNGKAFPSNEDVAITIRIYDALAHIDVKLFDHIIISEDDCVSMTQSQKYHHIFTR